jgi:hypothetical protein
MSKMYRKNPLPGHAYHTKTDDELRTLMLADDYEALVILHWHIAPPGD